MNPGSDSSIPDDVFALRIQQLLMATPTQLESARAFQADCAREGKPLPLADALVKLGIVTLAQRDTVEERLRAEQKTGLARLLHYKLLRKIGEGAMGAVYLAEDERDARQVALKVLPRSAAARPGFVERFQREADAAGRLRHPNIVHAFSSGDDQGWYFFVMEYCDGETQDKRLKRERVLPPEEATAIILQIARALQYAHGQGVVHRDVKPSNIILAPDGTAKILDLGLSKNVHEAEAAFRTQSGITVGTPHYMAPEQARGDKDVDGRADIYSLGATYYHFVTGDTPFHGSSAFEIVTQHLTSELPDPRDLREEIPDGVVQVIRMMMAKRREDRYADCGALAADLERALRGEAPRARPLDAGQSSVGMPRVPRAPRAIRLSRTSKRAAAVSAALEAAPVRTRLGLKPVVWLALGGLAAALLIVVVALLLLSGGPRRPDPSAGVPPPDVKAPPPAATRPAPPPVDPALAPKLAERDELKAIRETTARRQLEDLRRAEQ
jgi:eukaryotic-like serine/threonine-protein kinase